MSDDPRAAEADLNTETPTAAEAVEDGTSIAADVENLLGDLSAAIEELDPWGDRAEEVAAQEEAEAADEFVDASEFMPPDAGSEADEEGAVIGDGGAVPTNQNAGDEAPKESEADLGAALDDVLADAAAALGEDPASDEAAPEADAPASEAEAETPTPPEADADAEVQSEADASIDAEAAPAAGTEADDSAVSGAEAEAAEAQASEAGDGAASDVDASMLDVDPDVLASELDDQLDAAEELAAEVETSGGSAPNDAEGAERPSIADLDERLAAAPEAQREDDDEPLMDALGEDGDEPLVAASEPAGGPQPAFDDGSALPSGADASAKAAAASDAAEETGGAGVDPSAFEVKVEAEGARDTALERARGLAWKVATTVSLPMEYVPEPKRQWVAMVAGVTLVNACLVWAAVLVLR